jgi:hypothetical protein
MELNDGNGESDIKKMKKSGNATPSPFETLSDVDRSLFDLVWKSFENGVSQEVHTPGP